MKKITIYKTEQDVSFDLSLLGANTFTPLSSEQMNKVGFVPVFADALYTMMVEGYTIFKVRESVRKVTKQEVIEREMDKRIDAAKDLSIPLDMEVLLETIVSDLKGVAEITDADYLVIYDHNNGQLLVDASEGKAFNCLQQLKKIINGATIKDGEDEASVNFTLVKPMFSVMQDLLTGYVLDENKLPEELVLEEDIKIGKKTEIGAATAGGFSVHIKNKDVHATDVTNHLTAKTRVHKIAMDWDGCIYFSIDHSFVISSVTYEAFLKYKADGNLGEQDNFVSKYTLILPELSKLLNTLYYEIDNVKLN